MAPRRTATPPVIAGYTYVRPLGSGGFADVFLYEQDMPRRVTAVKVLRADAIDPEVRRSFNAEADVMARLSTHPAIVTIHQASISSDGRPYLAMEFCPETMAARYKRAPLPVAEVLDVGVRLAGALETAHRAGLLHRDIKPSNVLINAYGAPVLADFGIAAAAHGDDESEVFAMSVPWSAPEVLREEVSGTVASEIWSLAATLYTLAAGRSPFEVDDRARNTSEQLMKRIARANYPQIPVPGTPAELDRVLATAMTREPARRPASMAAFADLLRDAQYRLGLPVTAFEVAAPEWAGAAPVRFSDASVRGPVITTVAPNSRRAQRAAKRLAAGVDRDGLPVAAVAPKRSMTAGLVGAGVGVVVVGLAVVVLELTGLI
ncbi:serine/threonine protein kinase [Agromyces intestinalis]|uniref:non-specific serine/threonine protein kinase n=1 Tax=Agromyces intestinalis TaxID=2592652 RepID=A0A5C1YES1_9MICO|nr:serine/threonine-protein kinase [Agromyces intestinalis]QEO14000.1 serine/threonine protein kinase [Agromyces intestinalis]